MSFDKNIKRFRELKGFTQAELAKLVNISQSTIAKYELGIKVPTLIIAAKIAEELGTTCDELVK